MYGSLTRLIQLCMNKIKGSMLTVALFVVTAPVFALSIDAQNETSGSIDAGSKGDVNLEVKSDTDANSNLGTSLEESENTKISGDATLEVDVGLITIKASDVDDSDNVSVKSSTSVQSKTQLNSYARGIVRGNADIRDVVLSDTQVSVSHRERAKFFGIFPIRVFARASVASNGEVKIKFPWYVSGGTKKAELESKVKAAVRSSIPSTSGSVGGSAKLSAQAQAQILEVTVATMKSEFAADTAVKAKVE